MSIFINRNGQQLGPFSEAEIKAKLATREISSQDYVWWDGQANWVPLGQTALGSAGPIPLAPPAYPPGVAPMPGKTSGLAIGSLVCGLLGFFLLSILAGIPAIVMGHVSLGRIRRDPTVGGHGIALAGTIFGYLSLVMLPFITVVAISVLIALGNQVKAVNEQVTAQLKAAQTNDAPSSTPSDSNTNSSTTNAPPTNQ